MFENNSDKFIMTTWNGYTFFKAEKKVKEKKKGEGRTCFLWPHESTVEMYVQVKYSPCIQLHDIEKYEWILIKEKF